MPSRFLNCTQEIKGPTIQAPMCIIRSLMKGITSFIKKAGSISSTRLILGTAVFLVVFNNFVFFEHVFEVYPLNLHNIAFLLSLTVLVISLNALLMAFVCFKRSTKPILIACLLISSVTGYFMSTYGAVIDSTMLQNVFQTNLHESLDLLSFKLVLSVGLSGVLPSLAVYFLKVPSQSFKSELVSRLKLILGSIVMILIILFSFNKFYTSFFREHKTLRYYSNPVYAFYSFGKYMNQLAGSGPKEIRPIGLDAKKNKDDTGRELIILVIGEAVRADRLSLNGYGRETNPLLKMESVISFTNLYSCGTSTAVSVPCMFSIYGRDDYSEKKANSTENLLDVLSHAGVNVLWRDNNSSSKGVALNVQYEDYQKPENNTVCDEECRDEGMLVGLQDYIDSHEQGSILIVLHQMGNHGPAYYKRYPKRFEVFVPVCETNMLQECSQEEIGNAYDNSILYTDYFLSKVIELLKQNTGKFEPAMIYFSDHGESLGENGLYLHGLPYFMAPDEQKHIAGIMWFGDSFQIDTMALEKKATLEFSQDYLFHTILGLMEVETTVYEKSLDILNYDK